tara:strand:+ start:177 stop:1121 length:945 start_codon:yes stop_codon:yes gene_type:complete
METNSIKQNLDGNEQEIDLTKLANILWQDRLIIIASIIVLSIGAIIYSLSLPNLYQSKAILTSVSDSNTGSSSSSMKSYSGLANLAGISLPTNNNSKTIKAVQKMNTLSFFENQILPNIYLPDLMALKSWNSSTNEIIYDSGIYDHVSETWAGNSNNTKTQIPSPQESFNIFIQHFRVTHDIENGFIYLSVKHQSPFIAQQWTKLIIDEINKFYRVKDRLEAQFSMDYLNQQMLKTGFAEIKMVIAQLLQQKVQQLALIEVNDFYVFEYIDPPAAMEKKSEPVRSIICFVGAFLGAILGCAISFIRNYYFDNKT